MIFWDLRTPNNSITVRCLNPTLVKPYVGRRVSAALTFNFILLYFSAGWRFRSDTINSCRLECGVSGGGRPSRYVISSRVLDTELHRTTRRPSVTLDLDQRRVKQICPPPASTLLFLFYQMISRNYHGTTAQE